MNLMLDGQAEYVGQHFNGLKCDDAQIRATAFYDCQFTNCSFQETLFHDCTFDECLFEQCDLSLMRLLDSSFTHTRFQNAQVIGVNWTEASWPEFGLIRPLTFQKCAISHSTFIELNLKKTEIIHCIAHNVDFSGTDLTQANCIHTDFKESRFWNTNLTEANFENATNYTIDVNRNVLKKTKFSLPEAVSLLYSLDIVLSD